MPTDHDHRLRALAGVVVRVGLNLRPGQPLLITDPYGWQGVHPEAMAQAEAIRAAAGPEVTVVPADPAHVRALFSARDERGYERLVAGHLRQLQQHLAAGAAFLFLTGSDPTLGQEMPPVPLARFERIKWRHLGPLIQQLIGGASQWSLLPAPASPWANLAFPDLPAAARAPALWRTLFASLRLDTPDPLAAWDAQLSALSRRRAELNAARHRALRFVGPDTDLRVALPRFHEWCTARLTTRGGVAYVVNLPTEEVYTAPHCGSAEGRLRVAGPVIHAGATMNGIRLEFSRGRVVSARAEVGQDALEQLLATDGGARRLGEVAVIPQAPDWAAVGRTFHHPILDENVAPHLALGDAYRFCSRAWVPWSLNSSEVHVDLPLDAAVEFH